MTRTTSSTSTRTSFQRMRAASSRRTR
jgi:hypothetical protein